MDPVEALRLQGGAASWRILRRRGVTWYALDRACLSGKVVRIKRGLFALDDAPSQLVVALGLGGVLGGLDAARHHGLPLLAVEARPTVIVPRNVGHAALPGVRVLRIDLAPEEIDGLATSLLRTVLDCARRLPLREAVVVCDSALRAGLEVADLRRAARAARGPGSVAVRRAVGLADPASESVIETCVRLVLLGLDVAFECQVVIRGVGRVDFLVDGWLILEGDGFAFHSDRASYRKDRRRYTSGTVLGYGFMVVTYEEAVFNPGGVARAIVKAMAAACRRCHPAAAS